MFLFVRVPPVLHSSKRFSSTGGRGAFFLVVAGCVMLETGLVRSQQTILGPQIYSHGDPTDEEQYLLEKINRARMDPTGEGQRLAAWLRGTAIGQGAVNAYHVDPNQVVSDFAALPAVPPLAFNASLIEASRAHSEDLAPHNGQGPNGDGHAGWDGSDSADRDKAAGYTAYNAEENAAPGGSDPDEIHAGYFVDWGNSDLIHSQTIMSGGQGFKEVGVGLATKPAGVGDPNFPLVETEDFGFPGIGVVGGKAGVKDAPAYLLGVVYTDANGNGQYDVDEGVAGVTVAMDGGAYYTVTSASGGYALPLANADGSYADGTVSVHMTGLPDGGSRDATFTISRVAETNGMNGTYRANVKWDAMTNEQVSTGGGGGSTTPTVTLPGGGTVSRSAHGKVKVMVNRPAGADTSAALTVPLAFKGTAIPSVDYQALPTSVTIPAGAESYKLKVKALDGDPDAGTATLTIKVKQAKGASAKANVIISP